MRDVAGNIMVVGDMVAVTVVRYANLVMAQVIGFTPKKIRIRIHNSSSDVETRFSDQVAVVRYDS